MNLSPLNREVPEMCRLTREPPIWKLAWPSWNFLMSFISRDWLSLLVGHNWLTRLISLANHLVLVIARTTQEFDSASLASLFTAILGTSYRSWVSPRPPLLIDK